MPAWRVVSSPPDLEGYEEIDTTEVTREEIRELGREFAFVPRYIRLSLSLAMAIEELVSGEEGAESCELPGEVMDALGWLDEDSWLALECGPYVATVRYEEDRWLVSLYRRPGDPAWWW